MLSICATKLKGCLNFEFAMCSVKCLLCMLS